MDLFERVRAALADRYDVEREIGEGGMAVVYLAHDRRLERRVAIKVLRPDVSVSLGTDRFVLEIEIESKLQHPHIIPLHDVGEADGLLHYVMPFVEGESLRERLSREGQLELREAVRITGEVAAALYYAHGQGIVHRDIKPGNILLSSGHAQVADFGIARALNAARDRDRTEPGVAIGTPEYMSPEQASGSDQVDARSDQYSLACVLFEMLAGDSPFASADRGQVLAQQITESPPSVRAFRPTVPEALDRALRRAMAKSPADRYPSMREFTDAVFSAVERTSKPAVVATRLAWLAAAVAVTLAAATAVRMFLPEPAVGPVGEMRIAVAAIPAGSGDVDAAMLGRWVRSQLAGFDVRVVDAAGLVGAGEIRSGTEQAERAARGEGYDYLVRVTRMRGDGGTSVSLAAVHLATGETEFDRSVLVSDGDAQQVVARLALEALHRMAERERAEIGLRLDALTASPSALAVQALLDAKQRLMRGDRVGGAAALDSAIAADPDFRLAYFRRAIVEEWLHAWPRLGAAIVERGLERPSPRGIQWIPLLEAQRYFSRSIVDSATRSFELLVHDAPRDPDAWLGYAEALYHFGPFLGSHKDEARLPLERAVELGAGYPTIISHLADLALARRDTTEAQRYLGHLEQSLDPDQARSTARRLAYLLEFGSGSARSRAWAELDTAVTTREVFSNMVVQMALEFGQLELADSVAGMLMDPRRPPDFRLRGAQYRLALRASMRRWQDGLQAWLSEAEAGDFDEWLVSACIAGYPVEAWAEPMLTDAWAEVRAGRSPDFSVAPYADVRTRFRSVVHWTTTYGDSAQTRLLLDAIARGLPGANEADPLPAALQASLHARLALLAADTTTAIDSLTAAARRPLWHLVAYYPTLSFPAQRMLLAELLARRGQSARAEDWLDSFTEVGAAGDLLYAERTGTVRQTLKR